MPGSMNCLIRRDDCALVVIDIQERLLPHIHEGEKVVANAAKLARFAGIVGLPVLWTEQQNLGETPEEIRAELPNAEPIRKIEFGSFGCGPFRDALGQLGQRTLILAGIEAHICVAQTALGALPHYGVHVVADAVSSRVPENKQIGLNRMRECGAVITSSEMVMYELLERAGTDEFREVLPLVK